MMLISAVSISDHCTPAARPTAMVGGYAGGRLMVSNFPCYSGAQIHSLGRHAFQAVGRANCVISVSIPRSVIWAGYWIVRYFSSASGNLPHVVFCL